MPEHISTVASHAPRILLENSAAAMSRRQAGVFFTINDSDNDPLLFALDTTGADRGVWSVVGAANIDWESAAIGPCAMSTNPGNAQPGVPACVYIGDTGDNAGRYPTRRMYRVAEPNVLPAGQRGTVQPEALTYVYADRPHDVEAMYVAPNGDMLFITKRPLKTMMGTPRPALVFALPSAAWARRDTAVAQLIDSLPITPGSAPGRLVTDASLAADGRHLVVRTYTEAYIFATDSLTGRVDHAVHPTVCTLIPLREAQGEGVTWANTGGRFVFTSEGNGAPVILADCPLPRQER
jgi:hypothetical protein